MKPLLLFPLFCALCALCGQNSHAADPQEAKSFQQTISKDLALNYLLYLPEKYDTNPERDWPLVLFLHGAGERGDDLELVKVHGPSKLIAAGKQFPFIVASPQCPPDQWWDPDLLFHLVKDLEASHRVDPDRIYVTGLSMGGKGSWDLAIAYPEKWAAIAPVCGPVRHYLAKRLVDLPIWAFHGAQDGVVPAEDSEKMVAAIKKAGGQKVKLTIYPEATHDSWTETYDNPEFYTWLLSQKRPPSP